MKPISSSISSMIRPICCITSTSIIMKLFWSFPVADLGGGCIPPTSLKVTILAEKSASILNNSAPFRDASPPHRPKRNESGRKISLNFGEDLFFFFFFFFFFLETTWFWAKKTFEFPISAEKSVSILVKTFFFGDHLNFLDPPLVFSIIFIRCGSDWAWKNKHIRFITHGTLQ